MCKSRDSRPVAAPSSSGNQALMKFVLLSATSLYYEMRCHCVFLLQQSRMVLKLVEDASSSNDFIATTFKVLRSYSLFVSWIELKTFTTILLIILSPEFGTPPAVLHSFILSVSPRKSPELIFGATDCSQAGPQLKMKDARASNWFCVICVVVRTSCFGTEKMETRRSAEQD